MVQRFWSGRSVCNGRIVHCGQSGRQFHGGIGSLKGIKKKKMVKNWPNFETNVLANYSPKCSILSKILNFSKSTLIILQPYNNSISGSTFHRPLNFSGRKNLF